MAITSELLGKLGGADVEVIPFSVSATRDIPSPIIRVVEPPLGETWLVAVMGTIEGIRITTLRLPYLDLGGARFNLREKSGGFVWLSHQAMFTYNKGNTISSTPEIFSGEMYIVKGVDI